MRRRPVAPLLLMLVLTACDGLSVESGGPQLPNTCVAKADEPHLSKTAQGKGYNSIVAKGWFNCSSPMQDASLELEIQQRDGDAWVFVDDKTPETVEPVKVGRKYQVVLEIDCSGGTFRARARLSGHDEAGQFLQSPWYPSTPRTDPCDGG